MGDKEIRYTSATGGQKGQKGERLGGADPLAMQELGKVYGMGEEKYSRFNYLKGYPWSLSIDAMKRHMLAFEAGEERDPESGFLHTAHVAWHALALTSYQLRPNLRQFDDRAPSVSGPGTALSALQAWGATLAASMAEPLACPCGLPKDDSWHDLSDRRSLCFTDMGVQAATCDHHVFGQWYKTRNGSIRLLHPKS